MKQPIKGMIIPGAESMFPAIKNPRVAINDAITFKIRAVIYPFFIKSKTNLTETIFNNCAITPTIAERLIEILLKVNIINSLLLDIVERVNCINTNKAIRDMYLIFDQILFLGEVVCLFKCLSTKLTLSSFNIIPLSSKKYKYY